MEIGQNGGGTIQRFLHRHADLRRCGKNIIHCCGYCSAGYLEYKVNKVGMWVDRWVGMWVDRYVGR